MDLQQKTYNPSQWTWEFAQPALAKILKPETLNWANPASIPGAQLVKENDQRQVWRVTLAGESYYAKVYFKCGKYWQIKRWLRGPACLKEWKVARYAIEHQINCVSPVAYAVSTESSCPVEGLIITAGRPMVLPLADYWQFLRSQTDEARRAAQIALLEDSLAELLARAHQAGLSHSDLHPGNLLVESQPNIKPMVCLVDLHSVRVGRSVSNQEAIKNLAQLNQWFRQNATLTQRMRLLKRYMAYRQDLAGRKGSQWSKSMFKHWAKALDRAAYRHACKLLASRDRRIMRHCKYFAKIRLPNHWQANIFLQTKHPVSYSVVTSLEFTPDQWKNAFQEPEKMLDEFARAIRPIKNSRSTLVCRGTLQVGPYSIPVVAKRHVSRKRFAAIWDCLRNSRSLRAWKMSFALLHRGLPVAQPLAVLERRFGPYLTNSIFLTEEVKPSINLRFFITSLLPVMSAEKRRAVKFVLIEQLAELVRKMHKSGFAHRDMKATKVLIYNMSADPFQPVDPRTLKVVLVDLDGLRIKTPSERDQLRAIIRLSLSADLSPHITATDRARFLRSYLTCYGSGVPDWKSLWRQIQLEREKNYQDHIPG